MYLTYYPDLALPQAPDDIRHFCQLAKQAGVKHITLLSGRGEPAAQTCEHILAESGLDWTVIRAAWFSQNFSEGLFRQFIVDGNIALPVSLVREPFIDINDIADIAVASLTEQGHVGQLYEVTGPELLTFAQLSQRFTALLGVPVTFEQISMQAFQSGLAKAGVDQGAIDMLGYLFGEVLDGRNEYLTDDVRRALGRPATTFNQFILQNLSSFEEARCQAS